MLHRQSGYHSDTADLCWFDFGVILRKEEMYASVMLNSAVNLKRPEITAEMDRMGLWASLMGIVFLRAIKVGRSTHSQWNLRTRPQGQSELSVVHLSLLPTC